MAVRHGSLESGFDAEVERINYDETLNGRLRVNAGMGADYIAQDDSATITTLDGGEGDDVFALKHPRAAGRSGRFIFHTDQYITIDTQRSRAIMYQSVHKSSCIFGQ